MSRESWHESKEKRIAEHEAHEGWEWIGMGPRTPATMRDSRSAAPPMTPLSAFKTPFTTWPPPSVPQLAPRSARAGQGSDLLITFGHGNRYITRREQTYYILNCVTTCWPSLARDLAQPRSTHTHTLARALRSCRDSGILAIPPLVSRKAFESDVKSWLTLTVKPCQWHLADLLMLGVGECTCTRASAKDFEESRNLL